MNKQKLLWIDHSYHKKTASSKFFLDYLKENFIVDEIYDESWNKKAKQTLVLPELSQYSVIFIWQSVPNNKVLKQLKNKNVVFAPMYDEVQNWDYFKWKKVKNFKILCFSKAIYNLLNKYNFNTFYVQYYTAPKEFTEGKKNSVFLWQRVTSINFELVKKILGNSLNTIHIHKSVDPNHKEQEISNEDTKKYQITTSTWFDTREEFENVIKNSEIFIAPRYTEGIGLPILEAMAMGKAVIANDAPTMNEYIQNGVNGYLADFRNPKQIDFSNIDNVKQNAYESSVNGYNEWIKTKENIVMFLQEENNKNPKLIKYFIKSLIENIFSLRYLNGKFVLRLLFIKLRF